MSNSPKLKNLTPGSLPSGMGIHGNNYPYQMDAYQRDKVMMKLKSHYKKLDIEEEKYQQYQAQRTSNQNYS